MELAETKTVKWPVWRHDEELLLSVKDITSATAMWAIQQSPYSQPENLAEAIEALGKSIVADLDFNDVYTKNTIEGIRQYLEKTYENLPETMAWNKSKIDTGAEYVFTDRYSTLKPDYDFIDLGALARNVAHTLGRERFY